MIPDSSLAFIFLGKTVKTQLYGVCCHPDDFERCQINGRCEVELQKGVKCWANIFELQPCF